MSEHAKEQMGEGSPSRFLRFGGYNALVAASFLMLWALIVVLEVKVYPFSALGFIFSLLLPGVAAAFFAANWAAFSYSRSSEDRFRRSIIATVILSPVFIAFGVLLLINFKFLIGGHI